MTRIILVRHGRTPWNKDKIFRGSMDIPLDEVGREEASLLADWLQEEAGLVIEELPIAAPSQERLL